MMSWWKFFIFVNNYNSYAQRPEQNTHVTEWESVLGIGHGSKCKGIGEIMTD